VEKGAENSTGGRPATSLELSSVPKAIGVEVQNWETRFAVSTMSGALTDRVSFRTPSSPRETISLIAEQVERYCSAHGRKKIHGVGVSARGIVNANIGVLEIGNKPGWVNIPLRQMLESAIRMPVSVENDVRIAAIAEYNYTTAGEQAPHCLLFVHVDEGVGVGIILNGELYAGSSISAGEFGQMVIADDGGTVRHDNPGCWEQLVSNQAICRRYSDVSGRRAAVVSDSGTRVHKICQQALDGDPVSARVVTETARYLAIGIANVVWGLNPEVVVVSSALNAAWPVLHEAIHNRFPDAAEWPSFRDLSVRPSVLDGQGVLIGAATLAFGSLFRS
jgi:predicted NBD/HSP70 family sugar kinase